MSGNDVLLLVVSLFIALIGGTIIIKLTIDVLPDIIKNLISLIKWIFIKPFYFIIWGWAGLILKHKISNGKKKTLMEKMAMRHMDRYYVFTSLWQRSERKPRSIKMDIGKKSYEVEYTLEKEDALFSAFCKCFDYDDCDFISFDILYRTKGTDKGGLMLMPLTISSIYELKRCLFGHNILSTDFINEYPFLSSVLIGMKTNKYGPTLISHKSEICLSLPIRNINFKRCFKRNNITDDGIIYTFKQLCEINSILSDEIIKLINNTKHTKSQEFDSVKDKSNWKKQVLNIALKVGSKLVIGVIGGLIGANIDNFDVPDFDVPDIDNSDNNPIEMDNNFMSENDGEDCFDEDSVFIDDNGNLCYTASDLPHINDTEDLDWESDNITFEGNRYEQQKNTLEREIRTTQKDIDYYSNQIENMPEDASKNWQSSCNSKLNRALNKLSELQSKMDRIQAKINS